VLAARIASLIKTRALFAAVNGLFCSLLSLIKLSKNESASGFADYNDPKKERPIVVIGGAQAHRGGIAEIIKARYDLSALNSSLCAPLPALMMMMTVSGSAVLTHK
jgi:hypothetical protein